MSETHTKTGEGVLVDLVRESPVDQYLVRRRRRLALVLLLIVAVLVAWCLWRCYGQGDEAEEGSSGYATLAVGPALEGAGA